MSAPCGYYTAGGRCRATPTRRYLQGPRCATHSPATVRREPLCRNGKPAADRGTLDGLRQQRGPEGTPIPARPLTHPSHYRQEG